MATGGASCATTADGRKDFFGRVGQADAYAMYRPRYSTKVYDYILERLRGASPDGASPRKELALDVCCGSGQVTVPLAAWFDSVLGVDQSLEQLRNAKAADLGASAGRIEYVAVSAYELHKVAAPGSVDLITIAQAAHWLDLDKFFAASAEVLRPGGVLAVMGYARAELDDPKAQQAFDHFYFNVLGADRKPGEPGCLWEVDRSLVDTGFAVLENSGSGLGPAFLRVGDPPARGGFERCWFRDPVRQRVGDFVAYLRTLSAYCTLLELHGSTPGFQDPLENLPLEMGMPDLSQEIGVTFPYYLVLAGRRSS